MVRDNTVLRVCVTDDVAHITTFGIETNLCDLTTPCAMPVANLPNWMQRRLAVLMVMPCTPPTHYVENIGRRIEENVFWIHYTGDETDGDDTRKESKEPSRQTSEGVR